MSKAICISGMHRSGTSLLASWLQKCGVIIDAGRIMGPSIGNVKGHFEDEDFVDLQSSIIKDRIPSSKGWINAEGQKLTFYEKDFDNTEKIITTRTTNFPVWGWKDPRSTLFLEDWKKSIPGLKFIFIWREAHEVAYSLSARYQKSGEFIDKISRIDSYRTWKVYNSFLINFYHQYKEDCVVVKIDSLINKDQEVLSHINSKLNMNLEYFPINEIIDVNILSKSRGNLIAEFLKWRFKVKLIEKELNDISII